ncbi:MAG: hypothetical protein ACF8XB_24810, partial [Planctomycetota bacterium JB042]
MTRFLSVLLLAGTVAPGCAYVKDRGLDLAQTVDVAVGISEGLEFNLRATKFVQVGFGGYRGLYWAGLKDGLLDVWQEERSEFGVGPLYVHEVFRADGARLLDIRYPLFGDPGFREHAADVTHLSDRGTFDIGVTLNPVLFGVDVSISPVELVDFLAGIAQVDLLEDDVHVPAERDLVRRLSGEDARVRAAAARALRLRTGERFGYLLYAAPEQMPPSQIRSIRRWKEYLGEEVVT